ncbi:WD40/YVTN/BNR-like repeat-containing protein [Aquabacterium sp.]|uniref:WD40/YVTN/BNR-like repeat-containing protein n=1 Tax=Aquabacterium sp. TaxID=1872578 RepID=UPI002CBCA1EB|nr:glycosyl hydrolase [Aquabacterium sp.]HSW05232.1 glycosyl hydrolase [Aquabacterium sp.]
MSRTSAPASPARKTAARGSAASATRLVILVATRKGAWLFHGDARRKAWTADGPHFLGHTISHVQLDPRDGRTLLAAAKTGHLGPTIFRSTNFGRSWKEAAKPPAFAKPEGTLPGRSVDHSFWLTPGHASERDSWYAGTSPQGLFRSEDGGVSWAPLPAVNDDAQFREWMGSVQDGTPDGPKLHSIIVDPRDPSHLVFAMSGGGVHESRDAGRSWATLIKGLEVVEGFDAATVTFHDPHCVRLCPSQPDRLYQQNHCGIYRLDRSGAPSGDPSTDTWQRIGRKMPKRVGDIGFPMVVHPRDADTAWVFPMDGTSVWPRTSPEGRPAAYVTRNAGRTWQRLDEGLPEGQAWWTVKRQAMTADAQATPALYLGTTSGELWIGHDEGARWTNIARHLPEIYAVEVAALA